MQEYGKSISAEYMQSIINHPLSYSPLFLVTVIRELCSVGKRLEFIEKLKKLLECEDLHTVFVRVVERWEEDFGMDLVKKVLSMIYVSRKGLSESEVSGAAGVNPVEWVQFFSSVRVFFSIIDGKLNFSHSFLRKAAGRRCENSSEVEMEARQLIVEYFDKSESVMQRKVVELPWQWYKLMENFPQNLHANKWCENLVNFISDIHSLPLFSGEERLLWDLGMYLISVYKSVSIGNMLKSQFICT